MLELQRPVMDPVAVLVQQLIIRRDPVPGRAAPIHPLVISPWDMAAVPAAVGDAGMDVLYPSPGHICSWV